MIAKVRFFVENFIQVESEDAQEEVMDTIEQLKLKPLYEKLDIFVIRNIVFKNNSNPKYIEFGTRGLNVNWHDPSLYSESSRLALEISEICKRFDEFTEELVELTGCPIKES